MARAPPTRRGPPSRGPPGIPLRGPPGPTTARRRGVRWAHSLLMPARRTGRRPSWPRPAAARGSRPGARHPAGPDRGAEGTLPRPGPPRVPGPSPAPPARGGGTVPRGPPAGARARGPPPHPKPGPGPSWDPVPGPPGPAVGELPRRRRFLSWGMGGRGLQGLRPPQGVGAGPASRGPPTPGLNVAQPVRATVCGAVGRRFEPVHPTMSEPPPPGVPRDPGLPPGRGGRPPRGAPGGVQMPNGSGVGLQIRSMQVRLLPVPGPSGPGGPRAPPPRGPEPGRRALRPFGPPALRPFGPRAAMAKLVRHRIRNAAIVGSTPACCRAPGTGPFGGTVRGRERGPGGQGGQGRRKRPRDRPHPGRSCTTLWQGLYPPRQRDLCEQTTL